MVDKVIELEPGRRGKGIKNVTSNDPFLTGHFPGRPIMPGVMIVEACGQMAAIVCAAETALRRANVSLQNPEAVNLLAPNGEAVDLLAPNGEAVDLLAMIDHFKFLRRVVPGDQIVLEAIIGKKFQNMTRLHVSARVGNSLVAEGVLIATHG